MTGPIVYTPSSPEVRYDVSRRYDYERDSVATAGLDDLAPLATSPHWEDRVRAEVLRRELRITLPDGFPCIYETVDSPSRARASRPKPHPWVTSPDIDMLHALLPDYQELWDAYTSQWGPGSRRVFAVGRLDGLSPAGVYLPGTTPEQVIGATMTTHGDMYGRAPERLRRMHPAHETWTRLREERQARMEAARA